ncbi:MAG: hypothetical protein A3J93_04050 [Candidatus Magasanikbacteria bacterium RIFOXYC2_FULL_42_28]|uniref:Uncharacterized protein n=1 Tax=Candidatus Magasanikbacteria bacterium RIFOXYC2_FULL_42_28 TaxID=1798704 RepID=A0A1F6NWM0_9BACT|nr:MAG: hypothetical protein A3J93_04050 [Candidatus Magasanikbacteria bacterium RIFOXYC2_FULL_42_28]
MGNSSIVENDKNKIDFGLGNIYQSWFKFKRGKKKTRELEYFSYHLEDNLWRLHLNLNDGHYLPGPYRHFTVADGKRRDIAVVGMRDRVVHRLVYEYLVEIYDKVFTYDVWSCRKNKGLSGALARTQFFFKKYSRGFVWRADITKFFDNVKQDKLLEIICRRITDPKAQWLIKKIIADYTVGNARTRERERESKRSSWNPNWQSYQPNFCQYLFE